MVEVQKRSTKPCKKLACTASRLLEIACKFVRNVELLENDWRKQLNNMEKPLSDMLYRKASAS